MGERIASLNTAPVSIAVDGEIAPPFLLDERLSTRRRFELGGVAEHTHGLCRFSLTFEKPLSSNKRWRD